MSTWVGVRKQGEAVDDNCKSCLSDGLLDELTEMVRQDGLVAVPGVVQATPWMHMPEDMGSVITDFLTQHPLLAMMFTQGIEHGKEILCAWCATEGTDYAKAPTKDDYTEKSWNDYFTSIEATHARKLEVPTKWYSMHFYVDDETKCYYVIGPRDTMTALFGWHAKISDAQLNIDLKSKVALSYEDFLRVHTAVDYAERCHERPFLPK